MKKVFILFLAIYTTYSFSQTAIWKKEQMMPTKELADKINSNLNPKEKPLILNVGPMDLIKSSIEVGAV